MIVNLNVVDVYTSYKNEITLKNARKQQPKNTKYQNVN